MNIDFFIPNQNRKPNASKTKLSIPANLIESLLTNRQNLNIESNSNHKEKVNNELYNKDDKYLKLLKENLQLKEENKKLRDLLKIQHDHWKERDKESKVNDNKQSLANLLLSLSYEKQEENKYSYKVNSMNEINLIDDSDTNNNNNNTSIHTNNNNNYIMKSYCNTEDDLYSSHNNTDINHNHSHNINNSSNEANELNKLLNRTKSLLSKYQSSILKQKNHTINEQSG